MKVKEVKKRIENLKNVFDNMIKYRSAACGMKMQKHVSKN